MSAFDRCRPCKSWRPVKDKSGAFVVTDSGVTQGECHRFPPNVMVVPAPGGIQIRTQFPLPHGDMFCDEYLNIEQVTTQ